MRKASNIMARIGFGASIAAIVTLVICAFVYFGMFSALAAEASSEEDAIFYSASAIGCLVGCLVGAVTYVPFLFFMKKGDDGNRGWLIAYIVMGAAVGNTFYLLSGIFGLVADAHDDVTKVI